MGLAGGGGERRKPSDRKDPKRGAKISSQAVVGALVFWWWMATELSGRARLTGPTRPTRPSKIHKFQQLMTTRRRWCATRQGKRRVLGVKSVGGLAVVFFGVCALLAKVKQKRGAKGGLWKYRDVYRNGRRYVGRYGQERPNLGSNQHENARTHSTEGKSTTRCASRFAPVLFSWGKYRQGAVLMVLGG